MRDLPVALRIGKGGARQAGGLRRGHAPGFEGLVPGLGAGDLGRSMGLHRGEGLPEGLTAQGAGGLAGELGAALRLLGGPDQFGDGGMEATVDLGQRHVRRLCRCGGVGAGRLVRPGRLGADGDGDGLEPAVGVADPAQKLERGAVVVQPGRPGRRLGQLRAGVVEAAELGGQGGDGVVFPVEVALGAAPLDDEGLPRLTDPVDPPESLGGVALPGPRHLGDTGLGDRVGFRGRGGGLGVGGLHAQDVEVGEDRAQMQELALGLARVPAGGIAGRVEGGDPEELQHELAPLGGSLGAEGGQLLLLGEHRRLEGRVVHPEHRVHVPPGVGRALGHDQTVAMGLRLHGGVDPAQAAPDDVEMPFVLELDLGDTLGADARRTDLLAPGPGLSPQGEGDGLEQGRLARTVGPVDPDQPGGHGQIELVLVDPEVAEIDAGQQH